MAGRTGLEPATSGSTVRSSNQLSYLPGRRKRPYNSKASPEPQALFSERRIFGRSGDSAAWFFGGWASSFLGGLSPASPTVGLLITLDQPPSRGGSAADRRWISRRSKKGPRPGIRGKAGKGDTRTPPAQRERDHRGSRRGTRRARRWMEDNHNGHKGLKGGRGRGPRRTGWTTRRNRRLRRLRQIWGSAAADRTARGEDHGGHKGGGRTITTGITGSKGSADSCGLWRVAGGEGFCYTISPVLRQVAVIVWEGRRPCSVRTSRRCSSSVRGPL